MESLEKFNIRTLEIAGFVGVLNALRLPFGKECRSDVHFFLASKNAPEEKGFISETDCVFDEKDIQLLSTLVKRGDEHSKCARGIMVWCEINAPRYLWQEIDTYRVGTDRLSSESTMHIQGKALPVKELVKMKEELKEGTMQKRVQVFSYQTLRRIWIQRHNHRLPHWKLFCEYIESLPFANELILVGLERENYGNEE